MLVDQRCGQLVIARGVRRLDHLFFEIDAVAGGLEFPSFHVAIFAVFRGAANGGEMRGVRALKLPGGDFAHRLGKWFEITPLETGRVSMRHILRNQRVANADIIELLIESLK